MKATVFDKTGKRSGDRQLPESVFSEKYSAAAAQEIVTAELRNRRQGTHKTKTVSEIRGGGKKPWRQKGTGHARQGSTRSTQFRGGSTIFGPLPRDYSIRVPAAKRRAGLRGILSEKAQKGHVSVLKGFTADEFSTKAVAVVFGKLGFADEARVAYVAGSEDIKLKKSFSNLSQIGLVQATRLTAPELFFADHVVIAEDAFEALEAACASKKKAR